MVVRNSQVNGTRRLNFRWLICYNEISDRFRTRCYACRAVNDVLQTVAAQNPSETSPETHLTLGRESCHS